MEVKLKTLTPLFIGKGEELVAYNWNIDINDNEPCSKNKAYILKKDLLKILLNELKLRVKDVKKILNTKESKILNLKEVEDNIKNLDILEKEEILKRINEYKVELNAKIYKRKKVEIKQLELFNFIEKNNELFFYIPGSSIKGILRTYVTFKLLLEINNLLGNKFEYLANGKIKNKLLKLRKEEDKKKQLTDIINSLKNDKDVLVLKFIIELIESFLSGEDFNYKFSRAIMKIKKEELEEVLEGRKQFNIIISNFIKKNSYKLNQQEKGFLEELITLSSKIENYLKNYSWFFGFFKATNFVVRDSEFLDLNNFVVLEVKRKKGNQEKQGIPNFILALNENKEVKFELIIKNYKKEFFEFLKKGLISNVKFPVMEDKTLKLEMGRFAGANFKSFLAFLTSYYPLTKNLTCDDKELGRIQLVFNYV